MPSSATIRRRLACNEAGLGGQCEALLIFIFARREWWVFYLFYLGEPTHTTNTGLFTTILAGLLHILALLLSACYLQGEKDSGVAGEEKDVVLQNERLDRQGAIPVTNKGIIKIDTQGGTEVDIECSLKRQSKFINHKIIVLQKTN